MLGSLILSSSRVTSALENEVYEEMVSVVKNQSAFIQDWLYANRAHLRNWSQDEIYRTVLESEMFADGARESANKKMANILKNSKHFAGVRLTNRNGMVVASSHPKNIGKTNVGERGYFKKAMQGQINRSDLLISKTTGDPIFTIAAPVRGNNTIVGVLYAVVKLSDMSTKFIDPIKVADTGYAYMFDDNGVIFAYPDKSQLMKLNLNDFDFGAQMMSAHLEAFQYSYKGIKKLCGVARVGDTGWHIGVAAPHSEIFAPVKMLRYELIAITVVVLMVLCAGVWFLIQKLVVAPVNRVSAGLNDIVSGEGDLTRRLPVHGNDEIAELAKHFNAFVDQQHAIIGDIGVQAAGLNDAAGDMASVAEHMSSGSVETRDKAQHVSVAANEMSTNMDTVSLSAQEASESISMVAASAEEMSATVAEIAQSAAKASSVSQDAVSKVATTTGKVNELGDAALEISKVTEVITEISEQTNLLALNATIEAARAGEAGKGFAVVANEIKDLAGQTANATQEIKAKIDGIQSSTSIAVDEIKEITEVITSVNDLVGSIAAAVEEQAATTQDIAENVTQSNSRLQEVSQSITQSSAVSTNIAEEIVAVDSASAEMSANSGQIQQSAASLAEMANQLNGLVERFKV